MFDTQTTGMKKAKKRLSILKEIDAGRVHISSNITFNAYDEADEKKSSVNIFALSGTDEFEPPIETATLIVHTTGFHQLGYPEIAIVAPTIKTVNRPDAIKELQSWVDDASAFIYYRAFSCADTFFKKLKDSYNSEHGDTVGECYRLHQQVQLSDKATKDELFPDTVSYNRGYGFKGVVFYVDSAHARLMSLE